MNGLVGATAPLEVQRRAFTEGAVPVAVYGLGKMGLPLATVFAETTGAVTGVDVDPSVVEAVNDGRAPLAGEPGLAELLASQVEAGHLTATTDGRAAADRARVHVVIVPTLLRDGAPDLETLSSVLEDVAAGLGPGDLVIVESTVPPGTCREHVWPTLTTASGLDPEAFGVAFCPERTASGSALRDIRGRYPKVVGGVTPESARAAALVYDRLTHNAVHVVSDATTAEAVKVFEGVYRDVNIALANELARYAEPAGFSAREAMATANALPMCQLHDPGPGVGGHCIPVYPHFLLAGAEESLPLIRTARSVNESMPEATVDLLERTLADRGMALSDSRVAVLGLAYRAGVPEVSHSPGIAVVAALEAAGATAVATDPLVDPSTLGTDAVPLEDLPRTDLDAAVVVTPHRAFRELEWSAIEPLVVIDCRDALALAGTHHHVETLGGTDRGGPIEADDRFLNPASAPTVGGE